MRRFLLRLLNLGRSDGVERELAREIAAHLSLLEEQFLKRAMTPEEARRAARLAFGGLEQTKELHRDARSFRWFDDARRDVLHAARILHRNPVFALTAALSLAIGIGANTAVFTVANALLFRDPSGVADADRLVDIGVSRPDGGLNPASYPTYNDIRERATTLAGTYAHGLFPQAMSLDSPAPGAAAERAFGQFVTANYFAVLGAAPSAGRLFRPGDDEGAGATRVAVLSHSFGRAASTPMRRPSARGFDSTGSCSRWSASPLKDSRGPAFSGRMSGCP